MERLVQYTEQLQLAGAFLHEKGKQHARLSLILCDNVVELLAHERCQTYLANETSWLAPSPLTTKQREAAMGQVFRDKLNLILHFKDVSQAERDYAVDAHSLRNECYHAAATHAEIAWQVAWDYHELACLLFDRLSPSGMSWDGAIHQSDATSRILKQARFDGGRFPSDWKAAIGTLASLLRSTKPKSDASLGSVLSVAATRQFADLISTVKFVAEEGMQTESMDDVIKEAFFYGTFDFESLGTGLDVTESLKRQEAAHATFVAPLRFKQLEGWATRATALKNEKSPTSALAKYMTLRRESEVAEVVIHRMGGQLAAYQQHQEDEAMGN